MTAPMIGAIMAAFVVAFTWRAPRLAAAVLWSGFAAITASLAIVSLSPGSFADRVSLMLVYMPVIWVSFQFWSYWDEKRWRVVAVLPLVSVISIAIFVLRGA